MKVVAIGILLALITMLGCGSNRSAGELLQGVWNEGLVRADGPFRTRIINDQSYFATLDAVSIEINNQTGALEIFFQGGYFRVEQIVGSYPDFVLSVTTSKGDKLKDGEIVDTEYKGTIEAHFENEDLLLLKRTSGQFGVGSSGEEYRWRASKGEIETSANENF